jgi:protein gp37
MLIHRKRGAEADLSDRSAIEWTDASWNPVRGCTKISPGCKHCYAETFAERFRGVTGHPYEQGFDLRLVPGALSLPQTWRAGRLVFVNSMSDLFHDDVPVEYIQQVFEVIRASPQHCFQILTKRAERMAAVARGLSIPPNAWMGVSVETSDYLDRISQLRTVNAAVRFLSLEPLLGPLPDLALRDIHWVIVGGESGPGARAMRPEWVCEVRDRCLAMGVPFFFKQWGGTRKSIAGRELDGRTWDQMPAGVQLPARRKLGVLPSAA